MPVHARATHTYIAEKTLREDVRAAEVRIALVGNVLRQVAKPLQRR